MLCLMECFTAKKYLVDLLYRPNLKSVMSLNHQSNFLKHKYCIMNCYKGNSDFHGIFRDSHTIRDTEFCPKYQKHGWLEHLNRLLVGYESIYCPKICHNILSKITTDQQPIFLCNFMYMCVWSILQSFLVNSFFFVKLLNL